MVVYTDIAIVARVRPVSLSSRKVRQLDGTNHQQLNLCEKKRIVGRYLGNGQRFLGTQAIIWLACHASIVHNLLDIMKVIVVLTTSLGANTTLIRSLVMKTFMQILVGNVDSTSDKSPHHLDLCHEHNQVL
jgi:hypothetical protein